MLVKTFGGALQGIDAITVTIEVAVDRGMNFTMVGLPDTAVKEAAERVRNAVIHSGLEWPRMSIVVNLAPADVKKEGSAYDLAIAVGILAAGDKIKVPDLDRYYLDRKSVV